MTPRSLRILEEAERQALMAPENRWTKVGPGIYRNALGHHKTEGPHLCPDGGYYLCQASDSPPQEPPAPSVGVSTAPTAENAVESPKERAWRACNELAQEFNFVCVLVERSDGSFTIELKSATGARSFQMGEEPPLGPLEVWIDEAAQITPEQWASLRPAGSTELQWRGDLRHMGLKEIVSEGIDKITKSPHPEHKRSLRWDHISDMVTKAWEDFASDDWTPASFRRWIERGLPGLNAETLPPDQFTAFVEEQARAISAALGTPSQLLPRTPAPARLYQYKVDRCLGDGEVVSEGHSGLLTMPMRSADDQREIARRVNCSIQWPRISRMHRANQVAPDPGELLPIRSVSFCSNKLPLVEYHPGWDELLPRGARAAASYSDLVEQISAQIVAAFALKGAQNTMTICNVCSTPFPTALGPKCPRTGLGCPHGTDETREMARLAAERLRS